MSVTVVDVTPYAVDFRRRLPFHFGTVQVTDGPQVLLCVEVAVEGDHTTGRSMGSLSPMWFHKDPDMTLENGIQGMLDVIQAAIGQATEIPPQPTVFALWLQLFTDVEAWATDTRHPPLLWSYGVSLVEQAVIDAFCRATGTTFPSAVHDDTLGIDLGAIYEELEGFQPTELLPPVPRTGTTVRHTVGLEAPLTREEIPPSERLDDGLPQTVSEYIRRHGVDHFKIKLSATARDSDRLLAIHRLLRDLGLEEYAVSLDANEGYESVATFRRQWESLRSNESIDDLLEHLLYVEQPLPRDRAFSDETRRTFDDWTDAPPVIIDESDHHLRSLETALSCGYAGTSHKNCKGVFKGIANRCLVAHRNRTTDDVHIITGEDLTVHGPIALQQDLAVMATIGVDDVERNGHHYYRGLSDFSERTQEAVLDVHDDLYRQHEGGFPTLDIRDGRIELGSVLEAPFGYDVPIEPVRSRRIDGWNAEAVLE